MVRGSLVFAAAGCCFLRRLLGLGPEAEPELPGSGVEMSKDQYATRCEETYEAVVVAAAVIVVAVVAEQEEEGEYTRSPDSYIFVSFSYQQREHRNRIRTLRTAGSSVTVLLTAIGIG